MTEKLWRNKLVVSSFLCENENNETRTDVLSFSPCSHHGYRPSCVINKWQPVAHMTAAVVTVTNVVGTKWGQKSTSSKPFESKIRTGFKVRLGLDLGFGLCTLNHEADRHQSNWESAELCRRAKGTCIVKLHFSFVLTKCWCKGRGSENL